MFLDPTGLAEYGITTTPPDFSATFDHTFPYDPNAVATQADYDSWGEWGWKAWGSGFAPWLRDASKSYQHYRDNTGTDLWVDYSRAYNDDETIRNYINAEIELMKSTAAWYYKEKWGNDFQLTGTLQAIPNGTSENWQKTVGAHFVYGVGKVYIDPITKYASMEITFYMEDMYNFNEGMSDIASGTPDDVNGRFSTLGWAKEFKTSASFSTWVGWFIK
jgi:hypothetical protein